MSQSVKTTRLTQQLGNLNFISFSKKLQNTSCEVFFFSLVFSDLPQFTKLFLTKKQQIYFFYSIFVLKGQHKPFLLFFN